MATAQWPPLAGVPRPPSPDDRALLDASHLALLLDLARALSGALDHRALPTVAAHRVRMLTGAAAARLTQLTEAGSLELLAESSADGPGSEHGPFALAAVSAPERQVLRTGAAVWIGAAAGRHAPPGTDPLLEAAGRAQTWAFLPLVADERLSGVLALAFDGPRTFDDPGRAFLAEVASECASALARGSLFARERDRADASEDARTTAESRRSRSERVSRDRTRLYERERFARARAEADAAFAMEFAEGMERSQRLTAALARAGSVPGVLAAIAAHAPAAFGALGFSVVWGAGSAWREPIVSPRPAPPGAGAGERLASGSGWAEADVHARGVASWREAGELAPRFPATAEAVAALGGETWLGVPIRVGSATVGVLAFVLAAGDLPVVARGRLTALASECAAVLAERAAR